ncbi:MAG TPA: ADOP family duplicated permease [Thermoanaerobaculia bacterium]|jgi:putative ABC transport system permease protein
MRSFFFDLRYGLRGLTRAPGFAAVAAATLALGIGATVAIFGVADAALLRPLPYPAPERLLRVGQLHPIKNADGVGCSYMDYRDLRDRNRSFENLGGMLLSSTVIGGSESAEEVNAAYVSVELFAVLGIEPIAGRLFRPEEDREGGPSHVALLSKSLWTSRYGADPSAVGRKILIDGVPYEIVGVVPDDEMELENAGVLAPLVNQAFPSRSGRALDLAGRLRPGVTIAQARDEMAAIGNALAREYPEEDGGFSVVVAPLHESLLGSRRPALLVLAGAVGLLLLIACANTANLLLARGASRRRELSVRAALGAGRGRLVRQLLAEAAALGLVGGAGGLAVASGLFSAIRAMVGGTVPRIADTHLDGRAMAFAGAASAATVLLFGSLPAFAAAGRAIAAGLASARGSGGDRSRALDALVLVQTALCVVLLVVAGLLAGSYARLSATNPGLRPEGVLTARLALPRGLYQKDAARRTAFLERVVGRIGQLPGVHAAGLTGWLPARQSMTMSYTAEGRPRLSRAQSPQTELREVSSGTFAVLGIPILAGRGISDGDRADSAPVAVVNRRLADAMWPGKSAVGMHVSLFADGVEREVVGVVGDVRRLDRAAATPAQMYVPISQDPLFIGVFAVVRAEGEPRALGASVARAIRELDPGVAVSDVRTMGEILSGSLSEPRFRATLVALFAAAALLLASIGLYGVIAYTVTRRRYEIGVRIAMGATPSEILRLFVRGGMRLAAAGAAAGILGAIAATRMLGGLLYGVRPLDPPTFIGAVVVLLGVAFAATVAPARRAAATDPIQALRAS